MSKRTTKKPVYRRRRRFVRRRFRRRPMIAKGPFPVTKVAKMRLVLDQQTFACTSGAMSKLAVQANRPYSGVAYAYGWNQWAALYNNYIVLGSKCRVHYQGFTPEGSLVPGTTIYPGYMGIYLSDDTTNFTTYTTMMEAKKGTWRSINSVNTRPCKAISKYSAKKHYNIKDIKDNVSRLGAVMTAGPTDAAYYNIWFQPADQASGITYQAIVIVDYIVMFSEPKDVAAS